VLTNLDTWDVLRGLSANVAFHLYLKGAAERPARQV
jgi:hypothetical protein